ncbi:MAG: hypothetical protein OXF07_12330 [Rhodobacter sp.]|nr:hypothetical protein [Rhodobacter sp.]MCY4169471.1 hypothetical protein [Rhodobacter sp.]MCY4241167.1 hypothetical protein [Rhodobacter sp.]
MTALKQYQRLEFPGVWRASPKHQRKNVVVCMGNATLIIYDYADQPLTHWSLPALIRLNGNGRPAVFAPGADSTEELEISDDSMIDAIEQVRNAIERQGPRNLKPRLSIIACAICAMLVICMAWLPELLVNHAATLVPDAKRVELGERLLFQIQRISGVSCHTPTGTAALDRLHTRLLGDRPGRLVVLSNGVAWTNHLPGGLLLLDPTLVEDHEAPDVVAGYVIAEAIRADARDPVARILEQAGLVAAFRLLTTGDVSESVLLAQAGALLSQPYKPVLNETLLERFRSLGIPIRPYAIAVSRFDEEALALANSDSGGNSPVLSDADWVNLQRICG